MKHFLLLSILSLGLFSCFKNEDGYPDNNGQVDTNGEWQVNSYTRNQSNNTASYNGFSVRFTASGDMTASKNGITYTGRWRKMSDTFRIDNFNAAPFAQLNKDWKINYINLYEVNLQHLEIGDSSYILFRKQ